MHYPLFACVGADHFQAYEALHTHLITLLVGPLMVTEALLVGLLWLQPPSTLKLEVDADAYNRATALGAALLVVIWVRSSAAFRLKVCSNLAAMSMPVVVSFPGREISDWQRQGCYLCLYQDDVRVCRALATTMWHALQGSTALLQVPCHTILAQGFDAGAHARLVRTNWIRTCCWYGCMLALCVVSNALSLWLRLRVIAGLRARSWHCG